ncbi:tail protein X [Lachnotalea glycerini]|uniref:Phage tail protein n=1 Tax=Lachnotalea glycerini TaxID=1763509 RepID=A0A371J2Y1_9FIRM|nr:tail protein X [Lachnotalea glycerini]RDY27139.1 phage tail protein [Lachnotalea glycerini]
MNTYTTIQGQTWDMIALEVYGSEFYAGYLMSQNIKLLDYFIFPEGIILNIPELPDSEATVEQPDWRSDVS